MIETYIAPVTLVFCAAIIAALAYSLIKKYRLFEENAKRTTAKVISISPLGDQGRMVPIVEFSDEFGEIVRQKSQQYGSFGIKSGDSVEILYLRKKVFGLSAWNIFILKKPDSKPYKMYMILGCIMATIAVLLVVIAGVLFI